MKAIQTLAISALIFTAVSANLHAKECFNAKSVDVKWTSFKTLAKVGVSGNFTKVDFSAPTNAASIAELLKDSKTTLSLTHLDAKNDVKNASIANFFVKSLSSNKVVAKISDVTKSVIMVDILLNEVSKTIPMKYSVTDNKLIATGVIDALDFSMKGALNNLTANVAPHLGKGWFDIPLSFEVDVTKECK